MCVGSSLDVLEGLGALLTVAICYPDRNSQIRQF